MKNAQGIFAVIVVMHIVSVVFGWQLQIQIDPSKPTTVICVLVGSIVTAIIAAVLATLQANGAKDSRVLIYDCEESDRYILAAANKLSTEEEVENWLRYVLKNYLSKPEDEAWILVSGTIMPLQYSDRDNLRIVTRTFWKSQAAAILADAPPKQKEKKKENRGGAAPMPPDKAAQWQHYYKVSLQNGDTNAMHQALQVMQKYKIPIPGQVPEYW